MAERAAGAAVVTQQNIDRVWRELPREARTKENLAFLFDRATHEAMDRGMFVVVVLDSEPLPEAEA